MGTCLQGSAGPGPVVALACTHIGNRPLPNTRPASADRRQAGFSLPGTREVGRTNSLHPPERGRFGCWKTWNRDEYSTFSKN